MNMLRLPGTGAYESAVFHDLCDELGILVWQDFMFANLDYPIGDEAFRESVEREVAAGPGAVGGRPSLAVLCGNSEVEQQVAMLGLDPALGRGELFGELLPALIADAGVERRLPAVGALRRRPARSAPTRGVANYYGVGGYRRPLEDARRAEVRFASECLAFANSARWSDLRLTGRQRAEGRCRGTSAPTGTSRTSATTTCRLLFERRPRASCGRDDHERYLELSRAVTGEVMAAVFGEWRRAGSPCGGGLVLWMRDLVPGAGWGVSTTRGSRRLPTATCAARWRRSRCGRPTRASNGVGVHVANDGPQPLAARLRVALYRDFEQLDRRSARRSCRSAPQRVRLGRRRVAARTLRRRLLGVSLRAARAGPDRRQPRARCRGRRRAALAGVPLSGWQARRGGAGKLGSASAPRCMARAPEAPS